MHGDFFWYDVMTTDTKAAQKFYCDVVGWTIQDLGAPGFTDYTVFNAGGAGQSRSVAGLMPIPDMVAKSGGRPAWMGYILVDDVDAMAARIKQEGGAVHREPCDVPGVIRFAVVSDPQGAVFLIAKPMIKDAPPMLAVGTTGTVGWRELYAGDWNAAFTFYAKLFGWTKAEAIDMGPMGTYQLFANGDVPIGGMMNRPNDMPRPYWGYYFNVDGIDAAATRVTAGGGTIMMGPQRVPGGQWIVQCMDPQGAVFALVSTRK